MTRIAHLLIYL